MVETQTAILARWVRTLNAQKNHRSKQRDLPRLLALTDFDREVPARCYQRLPRGNGAVVIRSCQATMAERRREHIREAVYCRRHRLNFAISADFASAVLLGADGLHMPEWALSRYPHWPRRFKDSGGWVSAACHNKAALHRAARLGVDLVLISPFYPTDSHPDRAALSGAERMSLLKSAAALDVAAYALGGISARNLAFKDRPYLSGLAGISCFISGAGNW